MSILLFYEIGDKGRIAVKIVDDRGFEDTVGGIMGKAHIEIPKKRIVDFCKKWEIREFSFFGSVLREDFRSDSDIDVLVTFDESARHTLFDLVHMKEELKEIFGRDVDVMSRRGIESSRNYIRKNAILSLAEVVYAA